MAITLRLMALSWDDQFIVGQGENLHTTQMTRRRFTRDEPAAMC
ncbi:MAG TPA: hypothetical protein VKA25_00955 [Gemmatimonadales bacterium]|nr:hypothetical protein [Gemmatimonadales bacterium]